MARPPGPIVGLSSTRDDIGHRAGLIAPALRNSSSVVPRISALSRSTTILATRPGLVGRPGFAEQHGEILNQVLPGRVRPRSSLIDRTTPVDGRPPDSVRVPAAFPGAAGCAPPPGRPRRPGTCEFQFATDRHRHGQQKQHQDDADRQVSVVDGAMGAAGRSAGRENPRSRVRRRRGSGWGRVTSCATANARGGWAGSGTLDQTHRDHQDQHDRHHAQDLPISPLMNAPASRTPSSVVANEERTPGGTW